MTDMDVFIHIFVCLFVGCFMILRYRDVKANVKVRLAMLGYYKVNRVSGGVKVIQGGKDSIYIYIQ